MKQTTIIYLPGLGDSFDGLRKFALRGWRGPRREIRFIPMLWDDSDEKLDHKLERIGDEIRSAKGKIVLVGESAGGPVALIVLKMYPKKVSQIITICGKNRDAENINTKVYRKHPAFRESMVRADAIVAKLTKANKKRIEIFYTKLDPTVRPTDTLIDGVRSHSMPVIGHMMAIGAILTLYKKRVLAVIKRP